MNLTTGWFSYFTIFLFILNVFVISVLMEPTLSAVISPKIFDIVLFVCALKQLIVHIFEFIQSWISLRRSNVT